MGTQIKKNKKSVIAILGTILISLSLILGHAQAANVSWIDSTGFWDVVGNWNGGVLPGAADDVTINVGGVQTITHRSGTNTINSLTMAGDDILTISGGLLTVTNGFTNNANTNISGGTLRLNAASSTSSLTMSGGTLGGAGTLTTGTLNWTGGQMGESGQGGGTTTVTGASTLDGTRTLYLYYGRTLNLNGNTSWSAGNGGLYIYSAGQGTSTLNIATGTTFTDEGAATGTNTRYLGYYGDGVINNAGTYVRNGLGTTSINAGAFNNTGTVNVNAGTLDMGPGSSSGTFNVASGSTLSFSSGTFNLTSGTLVNDGSVRFLSGTVVVSTPLVTSGTGTLQVSGGTLRMLAGSSMSPANLVLSSGTIGGAGTITAGTLNWSGGTMGESGQGGGTTTVTGASTLDGTKNLSLYYGRTLNLNGNTSWSAGNGYLYIYSVSQGTSTLNIATGKTFTDEGAATGTNTRYLGYYGDGVINNAGTYVRNGLGTTSINAGAFNNTGTVNVNAGTLDMGPGSSSGTFNVASGSTLSFSSGTYTMTGGTLANAGTLGVASGTLNITAGVTYSGSGAINVSGGLLNSALGTTLTPGSLTISGGTARFAGAVNTGSLTMSAGTLGGAGTLTTGTLNWTGGAMGESGQGGGTTTVTGASTLDGTKGLYLYYGRTLNLNGNTSWSAGNGQIYVFSSGQGTSTLNIGAGATFTDVGAAAANGTKYLGNYGDGVINHAGTYVRNGLGTTSLGSTPFNNTGTVTVNGGTLDMGPGNSSGTFNVAAGSTLSFSSGTFNLTGGSLANNGTTRVSAGTVVVSTPLVTSGSGTLQVSGGTLRMLAGSSMSPANVVFEGGTIGGAGTITAGTLNWTGGMMGESGQGAGTTTVTGASTLDGTKALYVYYGRTLNLNGNTSWTAGSNGLYIYSASQGTSTLNIAAGTTFTDAGAAAANGTKYLGYYGDGIINNAGTYVRNGLGTTTLSTTAFNNTGAVNVNAGTLDMGPGSSSGTFNVAAGSTLSFSSGTFNLTSGTLANGGTLGVANGTLNINTGVNYSGSGAINVSNGLLNSALGTTLTPGSLTISGGTARFAGAVNTGSLTMSAGILGGPGTVTAGTLNWTGGTMGESGQGGGTTTVTGASTLDGTKGLYLYYGRTLNLNGNTSWTAGNSGIYMTSQSQGTSTLNIAAGTTFTDAGAAAANGTKYLGYYGDGVINNAGTYVRNDLGTTTLSTTAFNNTGTVNVNAGTLDMGPGSSSGTFNVASGSTLQFSSGTFNLTSGTLANAGTTRVLGGTVVVSTPLVTTGSGTLQVNSGTLRMLDGSSMSPANVILSAGILGGPGTVTAGTLNWTGGQMGESGQGGGTTTVTGASTLDGTKALYLYYGHTLNLNGNTSWTAGNGGIYIYGGGQGTSTLNIGAGATFTDAGAAAANGTKYLGYYGDGIVNNAGTYVRNGLGTTTLYSGAFNNTGTVNVNAGTLDMGPGTSNGTFNVASGSTLQFSSGTFNLNGGSVSNAGTTRLYAGTLFVSAPPTYSGSGVFEMTGGTLRTASTFTVGNFNFTGGQMGASGVTNGSMTATGLTTIDGTKTQYIYYGHTLNLNSNTGWTAGNGGIYIYGANQGTSTLNIGAGATFTDAGAAAANGTKYLGYYGDGIVNNAGTYVRNGLGTTSVGPINNTGMFDVQGGNVTFTYGHQGTGTLRIGASGSVTANAANNTVGTLDHQGGAGSLNIGTRTVTVSTDYNNANFGTGNAFNRRANITGTGQILASGNVNQGLSGTGISNGDTTAPSIVVGNVRVGSITYTYNITNTGTTGPSLRGAIQNAANGGNITDARLSGNGVLSSNWGPVAPGASIARDITITINTAGIYTPIANQKVNILNNFENTRSQLLTISSSAGAAAYNPAVAGAVTPNPVTLANQREGGTTLQALTITNTAPAGIYTEKLDASFGGTTGNAITNGGSINLLAGGGTNNTSMRIGIDTSSAGAKSGSATLNFASDGTGTSGLPLLNLPSQTVNISGNVYRLASASAHTPEPVTFSNAHVGDIKTQALTISNTATNDGYSEKLNATIGSPTAGITASGSFNLLAAGSTNNSSLVVGLNTSTAGAKSGTATITLQSDGTGTSGFSAIGIGTQTVNVSGNVYRLASASAHTPEPVNLGNARVGDLKTQMLTLSNTAANDGFSEKLTAILGGATTGITASGSFAQLDAGATNNSSLFVGLDTSTAGAKSGTATITLISDGLGTSNLGTTGIGTQTVNVSGNVYRLAAASAHTPEPVVMANQRVGGSLTQALSLTNTAANDGFSEKLNASITPATGQATASGAFTLLGAGATNNSSLLVGVDTTTAGAKSGTATITLQSDGTGTSGFSPIGIGTQTVNVSGNVYRLASASAHTPEPVSFGNAHVGDIKTQALTISNTAANDGFSEKLNATIGSPTTGITASGSFNLLAPQATNNSSLVVGLNTATAGAKSGTATITLQSDGAGTSGFSAIGIGTQTVNVSGNVYRLAQATINNAADFNFGNVLVGSGTITKTISISNTATADGFSEALNAAFGSFTNNGAGIFSTNGGSITGLLAGQTDASGMKVTMTPSSAGTISASVELLFKSNGTAIGNGLGLTDLPSQNLPLNVTITGVAGNLAIASAATPNPVNFGKFRVGDPAPAQQALTIGNLATAPAEGLNASIATGSAGFNATGSFTGLAPGSTDINTLKVGFTDTASAGAKAGTATITLASDGTFNNGVTTPLTSQTINMNAEVYRLANPTLNTPSVAMVARVGDASPSAGVSITNTSPDIYTEGLKASIGTASAGFTGSGAIANLSAGGTDASTLRVGLNTGTAGSFAGTAALTLASTGAGTTGAPDFGLPGQNLSLSGKVYTPAVAQLNTTTVNFGIVHKGDNVSPIALSVKNAASVTALNDVLQGSFNGAPAAPFTASGNLGAGLAAGATDNTSLTVALNTSNAGVFKGSANLNFLSRNPDMADLPLAVMNIPLDVQINNFASALLQKLSGMGTLKQDINNPYAFLFDFGQLSIGSGLSQAELGLKNDASAPADTLGGTFDLNAPDFVLSGFNPFSGIEAGSLLSGLNIGFNANALGDYSGLITIRPFGYNSSGFNGALPEIVLNLEAEVISGEQPIPEPGTIILLVSGLGAMLGLRRMKKMVRGK